MSKFALLMYMSAFSVELMTAINSDLHIKPERNRNKRLTNQN